MVSVGFEVANVIFTGHGDIMEGCEPSVKGEKIKKKKLS